MSSEGRLSALLLQLEPSLVSTRTSACVLLLFRVSWRVLSVLSPTAEDLELSRADQFGADKAGRNSERASQKKTR